jgi:hypothetical protein
MLGERKGFVTLADPRRTVLLGFFCLLSILPGTVYEYKYITILQELNSSFGINLQVPSHQIT